MTPPSLQHSYMDIEKQNARRKLSNFNNIDAGGNAYLFLFNTTMKTVYFLNYFILLRNFEYGSLRWQTPNIERAGKVVNFSRHLVAANSSLYRLGLRTYEKIPFKTYSLNLLVQLNLTKRKIAMSKVTSVL